jgi:hypothetical protein
MKSSLTKNIIPTASKTTQKSWMFSQSPIKSRIETRFAIPPPFPFSHRNPFRAILPNGMQITFIF